MNKLFLKNLISILFIYNCEYWWKNIFKGNTCEFAKVNMVMHVNGSNDVAYQNKIIRKKL